MRPIAHPLLPFAALTVSACAPYATIEGLAFRTPLPETTAVEILPHSQRHELSVLTEGLELRLSVYSVSTCRTTTTPRFVIQRTVTTSEAAPLPGSPLLSTIELGTGAVGLAAGIVFTVSPDSCSFRDDFGRAFRDPGTCRSIGIGAALGGAALALLGVYEQQRGSTRLQTSAPQTGSPIVSVSPCHKTALKLTRISVVSAESFVETVTDEDGTATIDLRTVSHKLLEGHPTVEIEGTDTTLTIDDDLSALRDRLIRTEGTFAHQEFLDSCAHTVSAARAITRALSLKSANDAVSAWQEARETCGPHWPSHLDSEQQAAVLAATKTATIALRGHLKRGDLRSSQLLIEDLPLLRGSGTPAEYQMLFGTVNSITTEWSMGQLSTDEARKRLCLCHELFETLYDSKEWELSAVPAILRIAEILEDPGRADSLRTPCGVP